MTTSPALHALLVGVLVLAASVWLGGIVALVVVSRAATEALQPAARVALFRRIGRDFLATATVAMVLLISCGAVLLAQRPWDALATLVVVLTVALLVSTAAGVRQARAMARLRAAALADPWRTDAARAVAAGARRARVLRTVITLIALGLYAVAVAAAMG